MSSPIFQNLFITLTFGNSITVRRLLEFSKKIFSEFFYLFCQSSFALKLKKLMCPHTIRQLNYNFFFLKNTILWRNDPPAETKLLSEYSFTCPWGLKDRFLLKNDSYLVGCILSDLTLEFVAPALAVFGCKLIFPAGSFEEFFLCRFEKFCRHLPKSEHIVSAPWFRSDACFLYLLSEFSSVKSKSKILKF